jgi:aryl-phospho-beta-D-glucosidase BglC (GH1 family)
MVCIGGNKLVCILESVSHRTWQPWITPSIFENTNNSNIVDEFTLGQILGNDQALELLQPHWETVSLHLFFSWAPVDDLPSSG